MKKIFAMLLSVSMLMSLMGAMGLQTAAMGENESYPLLYETYETEKALDTMVRSGSGKGTVTITSEGVNGSAGALAVCQTNGGNYIDITYPTQVKIEKGQKLEISYWIKLKSELKADVSDANRISMIFYGSGIVTNPGSHEGLSKGDEWTGSGWKQYDVSNKLVTGEWVKVDQSVTWEDAMSIGKGGAIHNISVKTVALRVANLNGTNAVVDGAPLEYELDDFVIRYPAAGSATDKLNFLEDFDKEATTGELDGRSEDCSLPYRKVTYENTGVDEEKGYLKDKQANVSLNAAKTEPGRMYKISGWFRFDADDTATDFVANSAMLRLIFMGKDRNDVNFDKGSNYPSFYSKSFPEGEWTYLEYYYYMDYRMYTKNPNGYLYLRICPTASYKGGAETTHRDHTIPGAYSFDNIQVEEIGNPANSTMELDPTIPVIHNFKEVTQTAPGWNAVNATAELVAEDGNHYLKTTVTSATHGSTQTPFAFENGKKYRISFRAKLDHLEDGVTQPLSLILDRKVTEYGTEDAYKVPNYEYLIGGNKLGSNAPGKDHPWQISNEWQTFTTTYTTNFPVNEGMEAVASAVNPRCATTYLYTYDAEGKVSAQGTILCLDDFTIEELPAPTVDNISFSRKGSTIRVNYDYVPKGSEAENKDATLIRAFIKNADGTETNIGTFSGTEAFEIPKLAIGKQITYEVIPVSEDGTIGNAVTAVCEEIFDTSINANLEVAGDYKEASYKLDVISAKGETVSYVAALSAYDGTGKLLDLLFDTVDIEDGDNEIANTMALPAGTEKVKLMLLDAVSLAPLMPAEEKILAAVNNDPFAGDDEINVVFLGDSIYAGSGASSVDNRWVTKVGKWFEETYEDEDTQVNWYNKGVGGTTSHYSLVRMERDVLDLNPDMVFVTMTPNDGNADTSREMESVLRTLQELDNPPYVVKTYFTNRSWRVSPGYGNKVAAHYGIDVYDDTEDLKADIATTGRTIEDYFADSTHPNNAGYEVIANGIIRWLSTNRHFKKPYNAEKLVDNAVTMVESKFINAEDETEVTRDGSWEAGDNYLQSSAEGDSLVFYFTGNFIAFEHGLHKNSGRYEVYVDDELVMTGNPRYNDSITSFQKVCKGDSTNIDLPDGEHVVEIKTIACPATIAPEDYVLRLYDIIVGTVKR